MPSLSSHERERVVTIATFSALAALACAMPIHNDTWWHLRAGLETLQGRSPFVDHFSWTAAGGFFWNHSWLTQVAFQVAFRLGGLPLLTSLCAAAVVTAWWLVWRQCQGDAVERLLLLGIALPVSTLTWSVRPQVAIVLLPVVVRLVAQSRPMPVALVMAAWANFHAGFALGVFVLAAGVVAALVFDRTSLRRRLVTAVSGTVATLLTPLGLLNWQEIVASLNRSRANAIIEWQPPTFHGAHLAFWGVAAVFLTMCVLRWRRLTSEYAQVSALAACFALLSATQAIRNMPGFMMLALPPLAAMVFARRQSGAVTSSESLAGSRRLPVIQGAIVGLAGVAAAGLWTHPTEAMDWHPISPDAQRAIAECPSPIFNTYDQGGPIIWFVPSQPVFVDSRQDPFPIPLVQDAARVERTGDYRAVFASRGIRCAVLPPTSPAVAALARNGWHTRHADSRWVVLERPKDLSGILRDD